MKLQQILRLAEKGELRFLELVKDTSFLHGDRTQLYANIIGDMILRDKSIRSAPEITYKGNLNYFNYCVDAGENGIYIPNPAVLAGDPYYMVAEHCQPYLLVRQNFLEEFPHELENYVLDAIRGKDVATALAILTYNPRYASSLVLKLLKSAIANAENNNGMKAENLYVAECYANKGPTMKRIRPRAQGRAYRIEKRMSHITLVLDEK